MKKLMWWCLWTVLIVLLLGTVPAAQTSSPAAARDVYYYGIEINGILCGYAEAVFSPFLQDGRKLVLLEETIVTKLKALGGKVDSRMVIKYFLDPSMSRFAGHDFLIEQGPTRLESAIRIADGKAIVSGTGMKEEAVLLPGDVVLANTVFFPHLREDFGRRGMESKTYRVFDGRDAKVQEIAYTKTGTAPLRLAGRDYQAVVLEVLNRTNGLKFKMWLDPESGLQLQTELQNRRQFLADASVMPAIQAADLDSSLTVKTNRKIADYRRISFMKIRAAFHPAGLWITPESLTVPGQRFTGTVKDNLVEGEFEVSHPRYDGANALPFPPPDLGREATLKEFLEASDLIQSDDPVLVAEARKIASGSRDAWEAVRRLSRWVGENIKGAIPGGGTARGVYDSRSGECGGYSFLMAAFCRALGIPARVVWGCLYIPFGSGLFAQHGWNEVYMGKAGWIPLDTSHGEYDYVDSGHIRIGLHQSTTTGLNPRRVEILDFRLGPEK